MYLATSAHGRAVSSYQALAEISGEACHRAAIGRRAGYVRHAYIESMVLLAS